VKDAAMNVEPTQQPLRILQVHNRYRERGGEDVVAEAEARLLRAAGHTVEVYQRDSAELGQAPMAAAFTALWSPRAVRDIERLCDAARPDVIHLHNTFPLISPAPHWLGARRRIPVVQTLHNFRLLCPQAMLLRDGQVCRDCVGRAPWRAVTRACYHGSVLQSGAAAAALATHRLLGSYRRPGTRFIALSHFSRAQFIAGGLPAMRIDVKPNFVEPGPAPAWRGRAGGLFVGRLAEEKGVEVLCAAVQRLPRGAGGLRVRLVGDGPLASALAPTFGADCLGRRSPAEVRALLRGSSFLVAPSTCLETFGLAAVEAFACGVPVIASAHGGLGELVEHGETGLLVRPGDASDLAAKLAWAFHHPEQMLAMGRRAYARYLLRYTPQQNLATLEDIYYSAMLANLGLNYA
jgi:glycosyltransferase involved in cell wall biosynthesis